MEIGSTNYILAEILGDIMKSYSFVLSANDLKAFKERVPKNERQRFVREFIKNDYSLSHKNLSVIQTSPKPFVSFPFYLPDDVMNRMDRAIVEARNNGFEINRSAVMRDIINQINRSIIPGDILERRAKERPFIVEESDLKQLNDFVGPREKNQAIEDFILNEYIPTRDQSILRLKPTEKKQWKVRMREEAFHKLDTMVGHIHEPGITRTSLLRDALKQLLVKLSKTSPKEQFLDQQLKQVIDEYRSVADPETIREKVGKYLFDDNKK